MTNLLIPTNFSSSSFNLAEQAVTQINKPVNIVFFHAYEMPFYYADLFGTVQPPYFNLLNKNFWDLCTGLKNKYPRLIGKVSFQSMQGNTNALFRNFASDNEIDLIVCPDNYQYVQTHERSLNPIPFFKESKLPLLQQLFNQTGRVAETIVQQKKLAGLQYN